jgi:hypothetical protein
MSPEILVSTWRHVAMTARTIGIGSWIGEGLQILSMAGQIALLYFCIEFVLPRAMFDADLRGLDLPGAIAGGLSLGVILARFWWVPVGLIAAAAIWLAWKTPRDRYRATFRLGISVLVASSMMVSVGIAMATITGLVMIGAAR